MNRPLDMGMSVYLDLLRFLSAIAVVLSHVWRLIFPNFPLPWPGHAAVIVFFVISGYVIAFAADRPGQSAPVYALHRAVRILSVSVPALILALCIAPFVGNDPIPLAGAVPFPQDDLWRATSMNLLFLGESWFGRVLPPFNPPFWSLSYEVWYYAIFGAWTFTPARFRLPCAAAIALFAGLKIALLLPVWLMGVMAYRLGSNTEPRTASRVFTLTALLAFAFFWFDCAIKIRVWLQLLAPVFMRDLHGSDQFLGDYILAAIVALNFRAAVSMGPNFDALVRLAQPIRFVASFTLTTYLLHMPLTVLIWNVLGIHIVWAYALLLCGAIFVAGSLTERRHRQIRAWIERVFRLRGAAVDQAKPA